MYRTLLLGSALLLLVGCSKTTFKPIASSNQTTLASGPLVFYTLSDSIPEDAVAIGEWTHINSWDSKQDKMYESIKAKAHSMGANVVKIEAYRFFDGSSTLKGTFYAHPKSDTLLTDLQKRRAQRLVECNCSKIHVYRDHESSLAAKRQIKVFVNNTSFGSLNSRNVFTIPLEGEGEVIVSNPLSNQLKLMVAPGREFYVQTYQVVETHYSSGSTAAILGPQIFKIKEHVLDRAYFETLAKDLRKWDNY